MKTLHTKDQPGVSREPYFRNGTATLQERTGQLTLRELEVLQLVAEGKANKQTASELCISIKTVEKHRGKLTEKLGIHGTAGLTRYAIATGVIPCTPWLNGDREPSPVECGASRRSVN